MSREVHSARLVSVTPDAERTSCIWQGSRTLQTRRTWTLAPRLIKYLIKHKHWFLSEMASTCRWRSTPPAPGFYQVLRHCSFSFQEFSQRYSSVGDLPGIQLPHLRTQDLKNKQASHDDLDPAVVERLEKEIAKLYANSQDLYEFLLDQGVAKECARSILLSEHPPVCT